jgi:plastocyanin
MRRALLLIGVAALAATSLVGIAHAGARTAATRVVAIHDIDFHPARLNARRGDTVTWRFEDPSVSHNVTSVGASRFHSSPSKLTGTWSVRFTKSGTYRYVCTIHPGMAGRVVVR